MNAHDSTPAGTMPPDTALPVDLAGLLAPISEAAPCGENLEYDPEFILLFTRAEPKADVQYGDFVAEAEAINWPAIERDCRRLLGRTKDLRVAILLLRCRVRANHALGLRDGLAWLVRLLATHAQHLHPQPSRDDDGDASDAGNIHDALALRANSLAALTDPEGVLDDIRSIVLSDSGPLRLQVRDVERAFARPRPTDALAPDSVKRRLAEQQQQRHPLRLAMAEAITLADAIQQWSHTHLGSCAPNLAPLLKLLQLFALSPDADSDEASPEQVLPDDFTAYAAPADDAAASTETPSVAMLAADTPSLASPSHSTSPTSGTSETHRPALRNRDDAREQIRQIRLWFERYEPSSPVILLLLQAERAVGRRFHELLGVMPADLIAQWAEEPPTA